MLIALLLGLMGSLGHCVGMCSGIVLLLSRRGALTGWRLVLVHLGRISTYALLGLGAGLVGQTAVGHHHMAHTAPAVPPGLQQMQGVLALVMAAMAVYLAMALMGWARSPELFLVGVTRRWGRAMQRLTAPTGDRQARPIPPPAAVALGLAWGFLPCGLVMTALLTAAAAGTPTMGALSMLAFGVGTWPALLGADWLARRGFSRARPWPRQAAALVVLLFSTQMALRALAAWGWVSHLHLGNVMVW